MNIRSIATGVLLSLSGVAHAQSEAAKAFGARELVKQVSLSPDATRIVLVAAGAGRSARAVVMTIDQSVPPKSIAASDGVEGQLEYCDWASNSQLICDFGFTTGKGSDMLAFDRLVTIGADGTGMKMLTAPIGGDLTGPMQDGGHVIDWLGDASGSTVLMTRQFVPESGVTGNQTKTGLGVERVDPVSLHRTLVEPAKSDAKEYVTDGRGTVRIMGIRPKTGAGYDQTQINYLYRKAGSAQWLPLSTVKGDSQSGSGFDPYAVDPTLHIAYGIDAQNGRAALFKVALDGSLRRTLVYARSDVDIAGLVRIGRQHRVVGVGFVTDRRQTDFFDPELKALSRSLSQALPGSPLVQFVDASAGERKLLLWTGSDVDPGRYMIFDKQTRHLDPLIEVRPDLRKRTLSPVRSISFPAGDGTGIPAYLTMPVGGAARNLPAIVMPHGGPGDRDEWGFDWLAQFFAARGYAVLQPNFRGSAGYGSAWFQQNGFKSWKIAIGDVNDGGRWLVRQGIAAPDKLAIVGWSYGGYAALQSAVLDPDLFKAIVAVAPVTDLDTLRYEHENYDDFKLVDAFIGKGPHIREGSPAQNATLFKAPVLMFHGDKDQNVGIGESRLMATRLHRAGKSVELVEFKGLDHQLDDSDARAAMLDKADGFLRTTMGIH